jgi:hypothetical protein
MMSFSRKRVASGCVCVLLLLISLPASSDQRRDVGLVNIDDSQHSQSVLDEVRRMHGGGQYRFSTERDLRLELRERSISSPSSRLAAQFSGLSNRIAEGVEKFFYKGNERAIEILEPEYDRGISNLQMLAFRPDYADQIFEAGVILVRAYLNESRPQKAEQIARELAEAFPLGRVSDESIPPEARNLIEGQLDELESGGAQLVFAGQLESGCQIFLNGIEVADRRLVVAKGKDYFWRVDCVDESSSVWRVSELTTGETRQIPVSTGDPLSEEDSDISEVSRRELEADFALLCSSTDLSRILGFLEADKRKNGALRVFDYRCETRSGVWSHRFSRARAGTQVGRILRGKEVAPAATLRRDDSETVMNWGLIAGGSVLTGAGLVAGISANARLREVECSPTLNRQGRPDSCRGVDRIGFANRGEAKNAESTAKWVRGFGYAGIAIGAAAVSWGVWRMIDTSREESLARSPATRFQVGPRRVSLTVPF